MIVWLVVAVLALIGEVLTTGLFLASVASAAAITAVVAILIPLTAVQVGVFAALSLVGILVIRPIVVSTLGMDTIQHTGEISHRHVEGRRAVVTQTVDQLGGQIRLGQGEFWSARLYTGEDEVPPGRYVEIMYVEGVTALVSPVLPKKVLPSDTTASTVTGDS